MGNLLRVIINSEGHEPSSPGTRVSNIFVDFENVQPTESEQETWKKVQSVIDSSHSILKDIQSYVGASAEIREAISNPGDKDIQDKTWTVVCLLAVRLKAFYEFSFHLAQVIPELLEMLCSQDLTPREHLETQQALFKQFAEVLDFVLKFDDLKMANPAIQNDFSYYRRMLNHRKSKNQNTEEERLEVTNEMANRMSLFYAEATPMLKSLTDIISQFVSLHKELPVEQTTECLSTMACICRVMIENPDYSSRFKNEETKFFCLRVMVGVIILYDHVHPIGAFVKTSSIEMKSSVKVLKDQEPAKVEGLLNALRFSTKHLHDESTPRVIRTILT